MTPYWERRELIPFQRLIDQGCKTIITVGFLQSEATAAAAVANPTVAFAQVDTRIAVAWTSSDGDRVRAG